jgi:hypothetical protein
LSKRENRICQLTPATLQPIPDEQKSELRAELDACTFGSTASTGFYRVPWVEAAELVKARRVLVSNKSYFPICENGIC